MMQKRLSFVFVLLCLTIPIIFTGCDDENTEYVLKQYHYQATDHWQRFQKIDNVSTDLLCDPHSQSCLMGDANDWFEIHPFEWLWNWEWRRDRYMFMGCNENADNCKDYPLFGGSNDGGFWTAGGYAYYEGFSDTTWDSGPVAHIRHYKRGQCSASLPTDALNVLMDTLAAIYEDVIDDSFAIYDAEFQPGSSYIKTYIGSEERNYASGDDKDFIHFHLRFRIKPLSAGHWYWDNDIYFRLVGQPRSENLYCPNGKNCQTLTCTTDSDCSDVPGAVCNAANFCQKQFLDVEDYGMTNSYERHCNPAGVVDLVCKSYYEGFKDSMNNFANDTEKLHKDFFAPLLDGMYGLSWYPSGLDCTEDVECVDLAAGTNFEARCSIADNPDDQDQCEFRPMNIFRVNLYPHELEMVLARGDGDPEHNWITILGGLCGEDDPGWSPVSWTWPLNQ